MTGPRADEPTRDILTIDEAAALLGVSTKTFAKELRGGQLPGRKIGREWKFSRRALIEWVGRGRSADFIDGDDESRDVSKNGSVDGAPNRMPGERRPDGRAGAVRPERPRRAETESFIEED